jgi:hypothetical protein
MNTTNTINVVADSQPDADSTSPSRHGTHANAIQLSAMCVPALNLGGSTVNKQGGISRLYTTRSGDVLSQASRTASTGAAGRAEKGYHARGLVFDFACRLTRP